MIPTLHPLADVMRRYRETPHGLEAEMSNEEALTHVTESGHTWWEVNNQASALYLTGHTDEALMVSQKAVSMKRTVPTLTNMAVILETLAQFKTALPFAREAAFHDPNDGRAEAMYGESLLRLGHFAEGWPHYARQRASHGWLSPFIPEWEGPHQSLKRKRILIIEGGGYGDNIYFLRWLDNLRRWGATPDYICQPSFAPLVRRLGYRVIENWSGNLIPDLRYGDYAYFTSALALGWKLGVTLENYRWTGPYIKIRTRKHKGFRVGICSLAGEGRSPRKQRSMHDSQLQPTLNSLSRKHQWVNLNYRHKLPDECDNPPIENWLDTANAIATCDLVVSVDTGVAHLAGAMGKTTWVILPGASAWQYPVGHTNHPLYPTMRMFWNGHEGMDDAVEAVCDHLSRL